MSNYCLYFPSVDHLASLLNQVMFQSIPDGIFQYKVNLYTRLQGNFHLQTSKMGRINNSLPETSSLIQHRNTEPQHGKQTLPDNLAVKENVEANWVKEEKWGGMAWTSAMARWHWKVLKLIFPLQDKSNFPDYFSVRWLHSGRVITLDGLFF